jgi:hypothetical protein
MRNRIAKGVDVARSKGDADCYASLKTPILYTQNHC